jgi:hypothetical protein
VNVSTIMTVYLFYKNIKFANNITNRNESASLTRL